MKFADFQRLKKLMARTTSESDPEALSAIRAANRLLGDVTWDRVLDRSVRVIQEVELDQTLSEVEERAEIDANIERAFQAVYDHGNMSDSFREFMDSLRAQWEKNRRLTPNQISSLMKAAARG